MNAKGVNTKIGVEVKQLATFLFTAIFLASFSLKISESCDSTEFECSESKFCLPVRFRCDGDTDCGMGDNSDELNCTYITRACSQDQFRCDNGNCIQRNLACDRDYDCGDKSDERYCIKLKNDCNGTFRCLSGECIANESKCDGRKNCKDNSDELYCNSTICTGFQCKYSGECLRSGRDKICDLNYDCGDKTDEMDCPAIAKVPNAIPTVTVSISNTAKWTINVISNTDKLLLKWENSTNNEIVFGTGKYKMSVIRKPIYAWATYQITFEIADVTREDDGFYSLQIKANDTNILIQNLDLPLRVQASKTVHVRESTSNLINFLENKVYFLTCKVPYTSNPQWTFQMCNSSISCSSPIKINESFNETIDGHVKSFLQFKATNHGIYRCSTENGDFDIKNIRIVDFPGNDLISIEKPNEIIEGDNVLVKCAVSTLYTNEQPRWYIIQSNGALSVLTNRTGRSVLGGRAYEILEKNSKWSYKSILKFDKIREQSSLQLKCMTGNSPDELYATTQLTVLGSIHPEIIDTNLKTTGITLMARDNKQLVCHFRGRPKPNILWTWKGRLVSEWSTEINYTLTPDNSQLTLHNVSKSVEGEFRCTARNRMGEVSAFSQIFVKEKMLPEFVYTNLRNSSLSLKSSDALDLICNVTGRPQPNVTWFWNMLLKSKWPPILQDLKHARFIGKELLALQFLSEEAQGEFMCKAENEHGIVSAYANILIEIEKPTLSVVDTNLQNSTDTPNTDTLIETDFQWKKFLWITVSLGVISAILLVVFGAFVMRYKMKQKKLNTFLNGIYKKEFYEGQIENINPQLSVSDQANLLPFHPNTWEVPRERLKLGIILGSGAFGLVFKAQAFQITEDEMTTEVAVKTVKANADESHFKALMTELKIMAHLGKHLNIVNLIGACTKNLVKKRELLVVMEFCKYGSLQTYMLHNRKNFLDQLDLKTDRIDPSICVQSQQPNSHPDYPRRHLEVSNGTFLDSYQGDYSPSDTKPISSTDLLSWAFQVAKGMEYLSSRKVLHGDLAARNVLLSENNIAKICNFGYARETFKNYNYKKDTKGVLLPIKWMAIESIYCGIFSSMSDCWSFGVFLWELFSLGNKPYPGLEVNEDFCERINDGYRMDKPQYSPISVYCIMLDCWAHEPTYRPTFSQLSDKLGGLISSWLRNRILDLNEGYARLNQNSNIGGGGEERDYLMQMGQPEVSIHVGDAHDSKLAGGTIPDRYQELPAPCTTFGSEPICEVIAVNKRNSHCRFFKPRPPPPPPRRIFE